ncbi:MAG: hypothetical protein EZS28_018711 [Streblomastix strix]|uniref:Uncharacterized protein n=1 Tax=Streblomastix strix TaxID=222440 RepID=A0A5J4VT12_9EUKA|nr:MAG: hypothetical protein EZS28_018711 [Streblomastix strix]
MLFSRTNKHITILIKGTQVSKFPRQVKVKRISQNKLKGERICNSQWEWSKEEEFRRSYPGCRSEKETEQQQQQKQSLQHNTPHLFIQPRPQQHSPSPTLGETLTILIIISPGDPRGNKEKELDRKQQKLQQQPALMDIVEKFHEIMKPIVEKEKKPKIMLPGQYKEYPNKDGLAFFYPPQNYRPTQVPGPKYLNLSEEQWNQFDGDLCEGVPPFCL